MFAWDLVGLVLVGSGLILTLLVGWLLAEICAGSFPTSSAQDAIALPARIAVIVPAHNEGAEIAPVLRALKAELRPQDRLIVVADNCHDDTFEVATAAGAEAIRRVDPTRRGKGYALDFAVRHLAADPPDVVMIMDADCYAERGSLARLASLAAQHQRPVQAHYEMLLPAGTETAQMATAAFSYRVKTLIRPSGLQRLAGLCCLMGTGMAFPWTTIAQARLATSQIVEDLVLSLDLTREGKAPLYCPEALVTSTFPATAEGQKGQRERWETGHVNVILQVLPKLLIAAIAQGNMHLLALVADTAIPPLALLALLAGAHFSVAAVVAALGGPTTALWLGIVNVVGFFLAVVVAWRVASPGKSLNAMLVKVPAYIFGKLGIYLNVLMRRRIEWVRTQRK